MLCDREGTMRCLLRCLKEGAVVTISLCCLVFCYLLWRSPVFAQGEEYVFYAQAHSSAPFVYAEGWEKPLLHGVAGECTRYRGDRAEELIRLYRARLLFVEEAAGTVSYYLYSPCIAGGILLRGALVNLHIAVGTDTTVGTPVIFSSF